MEFFTVLLLLLYFMFVYRTVHRLPKHCGTEPDTRHTRDKIFDSSWGSSPTTDFSDAAGGLLLLSRALLRLLRQNHGSPPSFATRERGHLKQVMVLMLVAALSLRPLD